MSPVVTDARPASGSERVRYSRDIAATPLRWAAKLRGLAPLVAGLVVWQLMGDPRSAYLPPPSTWWESGRSLVEAGSLQSAVASTVVSILAGLLLATAAGVIVGSVIGFSRRASRALGPTLDFLRSVPPPTMVPIAMLVLGIGRATTLTVVVVAAVWPVLLNTSAAAAQIHTVQVEASRSMGLTRIARVRKVLLPALLPGVILGVKVAAPLVFIIVLLVEMLTVTGGVGALIITGQRSFRPAEVFAVLVVIGVLGVVLNLIFAGIERRVLRHQRPTETARSRGMPSE